MSNGTLIHDWTGSRGKYGLAPTASNLAKSFTPTKLMCAPDNSPERMRVMMDIPPELKYALDDKMKRIGRTCLRENANILFQLFEDICVEHVLKAQVDDGLLRKLVQRNPKEEVSKSVP